MANLKIKVDYYDEEQKELIRNNFPEDFNRINPIAGTTVDIPIEDFKTYSLFRIQTNNDNYRTFTDLSNLSNAWNLYDRFFCFDSSTGKLNNIYPGAIDMTDVPEIIGIGGGLSIASHIYGLTQADWTKIGIQTHKDFDFIKSAVNGNRNIVLETKGSVIDNNQMRRDVSNHKSKILEKKRDRNFKQKYNYSQNTCLGIITAADKNNILQSWLVDPPAENISFDLRKIKLLKRLHYYYSLIRFLSKRTYFALALANRIKIIELVDDYQSLDSLPLLNANFEKIQIRDSFINSRATNKSRSIVGKTILIKNQELYFLGLQRNILEMLVNQNFQQILEFKTYPVSSTQSIAGDLLLKNSEMKLLLQRNEIKELKSPYEEYFYFETEFDVIQNSSGLNISRKILK